MIEVVFSGCEKGILRYSLEFSGEKKEVPSSFLNGAPFVQSEYTADPQRKHRHELGNEKPHDVIGLSFSLDIGSIASSITSDERKELIRQMMGPDTQDKPDGSEDSSDHYWDGCISDLNKLLIRAKAGDPVRIWYSDAPYSKCGFYDTIYQLKKYKCHISAIKLPGHMMLEQSAAAAISWGEIPPDRLEYYLPLEIEVSTAVQKAVVAEWETLKQENSPLRAVINGKLHSIGINFYDGFIRKELPNGNFKISQLIGLVLGRNQLGLVDWLIAQRIRKMIETGELTVIQQSSVFYDTVLKRT